MVAGLCLLVTAALLLNWRFPLLRFTGPRLDVLAMILACILPAVALAVVGPVVPGWLRPPVLGLGGVIAAVGIVVAVWIGIVHRAAIAHDRDPAMTPVAHAEVLGHHLVAFRVRQRGGVVGVLVREETPVVPGLVRVKRFDSLVDAAVVKIDPLGGGLVRLSYPPYPGRRDSVVDHILRLPGHGPKK